MTWIHISYDEDLQLFLLKYFFWVGGDKAEKAANLELKTFIIGYNLWYNSLVIFFI